LNDLIVGLSSFTPTDGDALIEAEPPLPPMRPHRSFDFHKLDKNTPTLYHIAGFVFDYIFTGKPRSLGGEPAEKLVELGFARFKRLKNAKDNKDATADEPLAILAGTRYFASQNMSLETFVLHGLTAANGPARGPAFEHFCAYMLALAFKSPTRLDSVFKFKTTTDIGEQEAQLVAVHRDGENKIIVHPIDITSQSRPTYLFGSSPSSEIETLRWLKDPSRTIFCFPSHTFGPDVVFVLRLADGTLLPILAQCKQLTQMALSAANTAEAFLSTHPSFFISRREKDSSGKKATRRYVAIILLNYLLTPYGNDLSRYSANPALREDLQNALHDLASGTDQTRAVRVLLSYPATPNLSAIDVETGEYPCATVRLIEIVGEDDNNLRDMLGSLESAVATRVEHEKETRAMRKVNAESKRKAVEVEHPMVSVPVPSHATKRKKGSKSRQ
jgi:hypothetical protein